MSDRFVIGQWVTFKVTSAPMGFLRGKIVSISLKTDRLRIEVDGCTYLVDETDVIQIEKK